MAIYAYLRMRRAAMFCHQSPVKITEASHLSCIQNIGYELKFEIKHICLPS